MPVPSDVKVSSCMLLCISAMRKENPDAKPGGGTGLDSTRKCIVLPTNIIIRQKKPPSITVIIHIKHADNETYHH